MTGDTKGLAPDWSAKLQEMEHDLGFSIAVNSGYRDPSHNTSVGGVQDSAHTESPCRASDIAIANGWQRYCIVQWAITHGIKRIGVGKTFIHLDASATLPSPVIWTYYP